MTSEVHTLTNIALKIYHFFVNQTTLPITRVSQSASGNLLCPSSVFPSHLREKMVVSGPPSWWRSLMHSVLQGQPSLQGRSPIVLLQVKGWCALGLQKLSCFVLQLFIVESRGLLAGRREGRGVPTWLSLPRHFQNSPSTYLCFQEILIVRSSVSPSFTLLFSYWR